MAYLDCVGYHASECYLHRVSETCEMGRAILLPPLRSKLVVRFTMDYRPLPQNEKTLSEGLLDNANNNAEVQQQHQQPAVMQSVMMNSSSMMGGAPALPENHVIEVNPDDAGPPLQRGQGLRGEAQQGTHFRDAPFAVAFLVQLVVIFFLAFTWGVSSLRSGSTGGETDDGYDTPTDDGTSSGGSTGISGLLYFVLLTSLAGVAISAASLEFMTRYAEQLIQTSLIVSCSLMGFMALTMFASGALIVAIVWMFFLALTAFYAYSVWNRIPFAAANLTTGLSAIKTNYGVCIIGYVMCCVANVWTLIWALAYLGVSYKEKSCTTSDGNTTCESQMNAPSLVLLLLSYYWTAQVLKNVLHTTIAGVVGTWWFAPQDANSMCSPAIQDSFRRATTYSFGSICMGSLLVAIIQTLERLAHQARRNGRGGIVLCVVECILHYLQRFAKYFNKWAFIYVGLYGYDYLSAGQKVLELFQQRGWTTIISDNLVARVLVLLYIVIGALTGLVGMGLFKLTSWGAVLMGNDGYLFAFLIAFAVGITLSMVTLSVVHSAVDTVIVSFAEAPNEFQANHPALSQQMMAAWRQVYPQECGF